MIDKTTGIWDLQTSLSHGGHKHDEGLVKAIIDLHNPSKVADLGCGDGWYCKQLKEAGFEVHGYEGCLETNRFSVYDDIMIMDLSLKRFVDIKYNLVLCLEVGEHIPKEREQVFLDNVREFTSDQLILSWAIPNQGGRGHFNEQPNEYIIEQLANRGFDFLPFVTEELRERSTLKWFKNTVMAYELR